MGAVLARRDESVFLFLSRIARCVSDLLWESLLEHRPGRSSLDAHGRFEAYVLAHVARLTPVAAAKHPVSMDALPSEPGTFTYFEPGTK